MAKWVFLLFALKRPQYYYKNNTIALPSMGFINEPESWFHAISLQFRILTIGFREARKGKTW